MKRSRKKSSVFRKKTRSHPVQKPERFTIILMMVKLGFTNISPMEKVIKSRAIVKKMTDDPYFVNPIPSLSQIKAATDALEEAQKNMNGSWMATIVRDAREKELDALMQRLRCWVAMMADNDPILILRSGF